MRALAATFDRLGWPWWLLAANLIGVATFLRWTASCCWIEPELKDVPGASGGAFVVWGLGPLPLFLVFVLANIGWAIAAAIGSVRKGRWFYLAGPFATLAIWAVMFVWDGLHHGA